MVKTHKLHKFFGLTAGLVILILSITGFFLDHDRWNFLYTTTFKTYPQSIKNADKRLFTAYYIDPNDSKHILSASKRGLFESFDGGKSFNNILALQINAIKTDNKARVYFATSDGIYVKNKKQVIPFLLEGKYINTMSIWGNTLVAVHDKRDIYMINIPTRGITNVLQVHIDKDQLHEDIKLSRFVRDLHYGRGLFDGDLSLYINDFGAIVLTFLGLSGFMIWYYIHKKKLASSSRRWIKYHANIISVIAVVPVVILLITGIFLDHSGGLRHFMKSVTIPHAILPPVYDTLQSDIWSIDYDGKTLRIGNRYGVYGSQDFKNWSLESRGFGYSLSRDNDKLYVGGMGASNRLYDGSWHTLPHTPHMFKSVFYKDGDIVYFSSHRSSLALPKFQDVTLYSILLTLHDGTFFSSWWIWINDYAAVAMLLLFITGIMRWLKKKRLTQRV